MQRSGCGIVCGHAMDVMLGSRLWNHLRIVEFGLVLIVNRYLLIDVCSCSGGKSLCVIMPLIALRLFFVEVKYKVRDSSCAQIPTSESSVSDI